MRPKTIAPAIAILTTAGVVRADSALFAAVNEDSGEAPESIYTIDLHTGRSTLVGPHGEGLDFMVGLAFSPVPGPGGLGVLAAAMLGVHARRRRFEKLEPLSTQEP